MYGSGGYCGKTITITNTGEQFSLFFPLYQHV
jgi:hypothetical protein